LAWFGDFLIFNFLIFCFSIFFFLFYFLGGAFPFVALSGSVLFFFPFLMVFFFPCISVVVVLFGGGCGGLFIGYGFFWGGFLSRVFVSPLFFFCGFLVFGSFLCGLFAIVFRDR
jgi:hypothetical protein